MTVHDIEMMGVSAIQDMCVRASYLTPYINLNDKEPSWDGEIFIYNNEQKTKKDFSGKVDVQVKATYQEDHSPTKIKFDVEVTDMKAYLESGGVLFFVVYVSKSLQKKIYYQALTPVKLISLLKDCGNQNKKRLEFLELPADSKKVVNVFLNFYSNCKKQHSFTEEMMLHLEDLNSKEITSITGSVCGYGYNSKDAETPFMENEVYLYAQKNNVNVPIPVLALPNSLSVENEVHTKVSVSGRKFYDKIKVRHTKEDVTVCIGKSVSFSLIQSNKMAPINFKLCKNFHDQIIDLDFLINAIKDNGYEINDIRISLSPTPEELKNLNLEIAEKKLSLLKKIEFVFNKLNITKDLNLAKFTQEDWNRINVLIAAFYDNRAIPNWYNDLPPIAYFNIQKLNIVLAFEKVEGQEHTYRLYNFADAKFTVAYDIKDSKEKFIATIYSVLTVEDYCKIDNLDYNKILPEYIKKYELNPRISEMANQNMLRLLSAYDKTKNLEQLNAAEQLCDWIIEVEGKNHIATLNKFQIVKRRRELQEEEKDMLIQIVDDVSVNDEIKFGAFMLLGYKEAAKLQFNKFDKEKQNIYKNMPIYRFMGEA